MSNAQSMISLPDASYAVGRDIDIDDQGRYYFCVPVDFAARLMLGSKILVHGDVQYVHLIERVKRFAPRGQRVAIVTWYKQWTHPSLKTAHGKIN